ncbi:MAG: ABC transporter ATP-binding protein [Bryobacteraceae bacterium]|nr:ABC transporter ATP-binding protein [Bryobacteraceae bacterium]
MPATIQLTDVEFQYGDGGFVLQAPCASIEAGARAAITGQSGSGKTTLLSLICGIAVPQRGRIQVGEFEMSSEPDAARRRFRIRNIGLVFQEFELLEYLSVIDNILLPYRIGDALRLTGETRERASGLAERVGLGEKLRRGVERLSHGERQRVGICRALVTEPPLVLADEPTGSLDAANKERVFAILAEYAARTGATVVAATHDRESLSWFDRVLDVRDLRPAITGSVAR